MNLKKYLTTAVIICLTFILFYYNPQSSHITKVQAKNIASQNNNLPQADLSRLIPNISDNAYTTPAIIVVKYGILEPETYITKKTTVGQALTDLNITYDDDDIIYPNPKTPIYNGITIKITKVSLLCTEKTLTTPFTIQYKNDPDKPVGTQTILQQGVNGKILEKECFKSYNGVVNKSKSIIKKKELVKSSPQIIANGTKVVTTNASCKHWDNIIDSKTEDERIRNWLKGLMRCESTCNPLAQNGTAFYGLLQFMPATYRSYGGTDIWNGEEQLDIAIKMYYHYGGNVSYIARQWPCTVKYLH